MISGFSCGYNENFWDVARSILAVSYGRFGTTYLSRLQGANQCLTFEAGTYRSSRNVSKYQSTLRDIAEERRAA